MECTYLKFSLLTLSHNLANRFDRAKNQQLKNSCYLINFLFSQRMQVYQTIFVVGSLIQQQDQIFGGFRGFHRTDLIGSFSSFLFLAYQQILGYKPKEHWAGLKQGDFCNSIVMKTGNMNFKFFRKTELLDWLLKSY